MVIILFNLKNVNKKKKKKKKHFMLPHFKCYTHRTINFMTMVIMTNAYINNYISILNFKYV